MTPMRPLMPPLLPVLFACAGFAAAAPAQTDAEALERLRRDQDEILRKAERLQSLMQRLVQRYEREQKPDQVKLLQEGLAHLDRSGILRDVAGIRDDLVATALAEALRKQREVVADLERLLNILLERKSVENLDQDLKQVEAAARTARELEQRQAELIERTNAAMRSPPTPGEQQLRDALQQLRNDQRREAERNQRDAGARRPFLESALERVQAMLRDQARLEQGLRDEAAGTRGEAEARAFDLGELTERTKELQGELRDQAKQQALRDAARDLQREASGGDPNGVQQARDRLETQLTQAPRRGGTSEGKARDPEWQALKEQLQAAGAGATPAEREALSRLGATGQQLGTARDREAKAKNEKAAQALRDRADELAKKLEAAAGAAKEDKSAQQAVAEAGKRLDEAAAAARDNDTATAQQKVNDALSALDRARARHQQANPDAEQKAREMAAEAASTAQELQNAPAGEAAEQQAGEQLRTAEQALRQVEAGAPTSEKPDAAATAARRDAAARSREQLEQAARTLQQALDGTNQGKEAELQEAKARQEQLQQGAQRAGEQLQQAARDGSVQPQQQGKAQEALQQAQQRMREAAGKLQSGQQSAAAREQEAAAQALQQAMDQLEQNRPADAQQQQALAEQAKAQQQLAEDIVRLAEELKQRENKAAQQKAQQAADAAQKAQRAMERGDRDETQQQQEQARQKLEEAARELEEERDRYQDLRQEELLFRMKDELTTFLTRQRPITATTLEAQKSATADGLSRAMRTKVNQLGEEEQELAGKLEFLVTALTEEGNLVYQTVLKANVDDLREVARRLAGRRPDVGTFTTLMQQDVERRSEDLLAALERERQRREQERQERQQQQNQNNPEQGRNQFNQQRKKLVGLIAELEMLKKLGIDTRTATDNLRTLVESRGDDTISDAEVALIERLGHRHAEITRLFQQIKQGIEQTLEGMQGHEEEGGSGR